MTTVAADSIFRLLAHTGTRVSSLYSQYLVEHFGLGINEWRILLFADLREQSTIAEICEKALIHKSVVSRAVQQLELRGLLNLKKYKRNIRIELSDEGRLFLLHAKPFVRNSEERLIGKVSFADAKVVVRVLSQVANQLERFVD